MHSNELNKLGFDTISIHAGQNRDPLTGALATPIYQTSTFVFDKTDDGVAIFKGEKSGYVYTRGGNPTTASLEEKIATLEGSEMCLATASGMGAISAVLLTILSAGDHIISGDTVYGGTSSVMHTIPKFGIEVTQLDTTNLEEVKKAIKPNTKIIYFESPTNPVMAVTDITAISKLAHEHNILVCVDNTFAPPPLQYPIKLGADIVVHSVTKYLNGHGDVIGGAICGKKDVLMPIKFVGVGALCGTPPAPINSYLVLRGMKTLAPRVRIHCQNALEVASYLENHPKIKKVFYPGLVSHPQHVLAKKQMNGMYTGILAFELKNNICSLNEFDTAKKLLDATELASLAVSLGDADTLIQHPASMTHAGVPKAEREKTGISDGLIRISVGLENIEDIIADLEQALSKI